MSTICVVALVLAVGSPAAARSLAFDRLLTKTDTRVLAAQGIERRFSAGATLYQSGMLYGHVQLHPRERFPQRTFDVRSGVSHPARTHDLPDLIVVLDSPLVIFNQVPPDIWPTLETRYLPAATF